VNLHPPRKWFVETRYTHHFPATWEGWLIFGLIIGAPWIAMLLGLGK
jgi:hypothetical protein